MVKVSIEIRNGATRFNVAVQAQSIRRAVSIVGERYASGDLRVKFPIDPDGSFVNDPAAKAVMVGFERPQRIAA